LIFCRSIVFPVRVKARRGRGSDSGRSLASLEPIP
jgi:hypothetical protein